MNIPQTLYDSFNARNIPPREVAKTFVISDEFRRLFKNESFVLLGPRGSGKTTLLKMLTLEGLHAWVDREAKELIAKCPFCSIYIPTDVHWKRQLFHSARSLTRFPAFSTRLAEAAVTLNVLNATVIAFEERLQYQVLQEIVWV